MIRSLFAVSIVFLIGTCANAQPKPNPHQNAEVKKTKEVLIKELEVAKKALHVQETAVLKNLDARAEFIIKYFDPKLLPQQLEVAVTLVKEAREVISVGDFDYGGNRGVAQKSLDAAEHHLKETVVHNTHEQRKLAAEHLLVAHTDVNKALKYSVEKYGLGSNTAKQPVGEPESRAAANRQLAAALPNIEFTYHLLAAMDHEIKDYNLEKKVILKSRDEAKKIVKAEIALKIKEIDAEIKVLRK